MARRAAQSQKPQKHSAEEGKNKQSPHEPISPILFPEMKKEKNHNTVHARLLLT